MASFLVAITRPACLHRMTEETRLNPDHQQPSATLAFYLLYSYPKLWLSPSSTLSSRLYGLNHSNQHGAGTKSHLPDPWCARLHHVVPLQLATDCRSSACGAFTNNLAKQHMALAYDFVLAAPVALKRLITASRPPTFGLYPSSGLPPTRRVSPDYLLMRLCRFGYSMYETGEYGKV